MGNYDSGKKQATVRRRLPFSLLLLLIAIASISAATVAWFSIADNSKVQSMNMEITSGAGMRFDLSAHGSYEEYIETLQFDQIASSMRSQKGFDMKSVPLEPVTTTDARTFQLEDGSVVADTTGQYLTFTLHFMSKADMVVHLTSDDEEGKQGTIIKSANSRLPDAMRISFTADGNTYIYDPGLGDTSSGGTVKTFGLNGGPSGNNAMFSLTADEDKEVECHVWIEGTDESCDDSVRGSDYSIALKFEGTDENNNPLDEQQDEEKVSKKKSKDEAKYYTKRDETADEKEDKDDSFIGRIRSFWEKLKEMTGH